VVPAAQRGVLRRSLGVDAQTETSGGAQAGNAMRGGAHGQRLVVGREGFQPARERSEEDSKAMGADIPTLRQREGGISGKASRT
jgi:hypothetical protein